MSVLATVALVFLASCTRNVKETQFTTENAKFNLIIAGDSSDFKDKIRNKLIARYKNNTNIDVVNIKKLRISARKIMTLFSSWTPVLVARILIGL